MHPIRKKILFALSQATGLSYSKLKPKNVEGNLFMYHLKQLITEDIIRKNEQGMYELTLEGDILMSKTSRISFKVREQPLIFTLIVCQNEKGEYLLYKRLRQPFIGLTNFPYGKLHLEETMQQAAERELLEKTGFTADLNYKGSIYKIIYKQKKLLTHTLTHIYQGSNLKGELINKGPMWECFWGTISKKDKNKYNPGVQDILDLVSNPDKSNFFETFTYHT